MSPVPSLPNPLRDGIDVARGSEVYANDQALLDVLDHGLDYENLAPTPNLPGTCISSTPGSRLPESRIEDDAVTADKLRDDATTDANRAVTTNHIRNQAVTKAKVLLGTLTAEQMAFQEQIIPFNITAWDTLSGAPSGSALHMVSVFRYTDAGNYKFHVKVMARFSNTQYFGGKPDFALSPALPAATTQIIAVYVADPTWTPTTFSGNLIVLTLPLS